MGLLSRRDFARRTFSGIAGGALLLAAADGLAEGLDNLDNSEEFWDLVKSHFSFLPDLYYFNNGSLGPSPRMVIDATENFRRTLDAYPSKYMWGGWNSEKEAVRTKAASLLGALPEEIALVHNTTEGMNVIASSLDLKPGDEVVLADHEHTSGTIPWQYWQETKGVKLVRPTLPILPNSPGELVEIYAAAITPRTKAISMCHMVNTNGMILPVKEVSTLAHNKGILVAVDGAQAAGMFRFDVHDLGCDFYATSAHKWLFSPKGVGVLYAKLESQPRIRPLIVSAHYEDKSIRRFENYNTRNLPEVLGFGTALDFRALIGAERIEKRIFELKRYFREKLADTPRFNIKTPVPDVLSAGITTVEIEGVQAVDLAPKLFDKHRIDCRPMTEFGLNGLRISLSIFNTKRDVDFLVAAFGESSV